MKIGYIELSGFRGFREKTRIDIPSGFAVISGQNGVGKSTVFDAVEYAFTGALTKYNTSESAREAAQRYVWWRGNGEPESHYVAVGLISDGGDRLEVRRTRELGLVDSTTEKIATWLSTDDV